MRHGDQSSQIPGGFLPSTIPSWAHDAFNEGEVDEADLDVIRDVVARLGLADVAAFELTWEDTVGMLARPHQCLTGPMP